jgi:hypothetical protein
MNYDMKCQAAYLFNMTLIDVFALVHKVQKTAGLPATSRNDLKEFST